MKRLWIAFLAFWASPFGLGLAQAATTDLPSTNPLNLTPPSTDFSMVFLANIFGVVDGVLAGTGSQVMGAIFGVFNSAILTLGSIILMHTVITSTINTAHQGEMLGRSFSSLWVPIRSTMGIALLLPKATGYCTMQIFVMWVTVQGVGAADLIWDAALGYLQRGGVLIQPVAANNIIAGTGQTVSTAEGGNAAAMASQATGAAIMATQQANANSMLQLAVCVHSLEYFITTLSQQANAQGQCAVTNPPWYCSTSGDLMAGADFTAAGNTTNPLIQVPSPTQTNLAFLNGICGSISWTAWTAANQAQLTANVGLSVDPSLLAQAAQARTVGVQQMWMTVDAVAGAIVTNRFLNPANSILPLGVSSPDGTTWSSGIQGMSALMTGVEMNQAAGTYLGVMAPTLNALSNSIQATSAFIDSAKASGWIMAGTYFFNLAALNTAASGYSSDNGTVTVNSSPAFCSTCLQQAVPAIFTGSNLSSYLTLMGSQSVGNSNCPGPDPNTYVESVSAYLCNTNLLKNMGQLGTQIPQFVANYNVNWQTIPPLPDQIFWGGPFDTVGMGMTGGYYILKTVLNVLIQILNNILPMALDTICRPIIQVTIPIFTNGLESALANYTNPIIAIAQMGMQFINLATAVWLLALIGTTVLSAIPYTSNVGVAISMMIMPFLGTWLGAMFTAGASMCYYIPILPYMLFTFGTIGWFIGVIEAMVAAPLVALGVTIPDAEHDVMGKGEPAMLLLLSTFLRPPLMIIGFVGGIILCYVGIWLLNTGFQSVITGLIGPSAQGVPQDALWAQTFGASPSTPPAVVTSFAAIIGIVVMIILYISMYISIVKIALEKLMFKIPDDILTWLTGGRNVPLGEMTMGATKETEEGVKGTAQALESSAGQSGGDEKKKKKAKKKGKGAGAGGGPKGR